MGCDWNLFRSTNRINTRGSLELEASVDCALFTRAAASDTFCCFLLFLTSVSSTSTMADIEKGPVYTVETPSPESVLPSKPSESSKNEHIEELLENDGVCGFSYGTLLCLVALGGLFLDTLCCYLALNHIAAYGFAFSVICSLVCFCTTISCIQEEKTNTLRRTAIWPVIKFLVTAVLYFCAIVFVVESVSLPDDSDSFTLTFEHEVLLAVLPISLVLTLIHWQLTKKASELMYAKDKFYMIENEEDSNTSMRASLRLYLAAHKLQNYEKF